MKFRITDEHNYGDKKITVYENTLPDRPAQLAMEMLCRFGLVAGMPDGEDSSGRQKGNLLPVAETVARAFDIAQEAYRVAEARGLMVNVPDLNEINSEKDAERAAKKRDTATA